LSAAVANCAEGEKFLAKGTGFAGVVGINSIKLSQAPPGTENLPRGLGEMATFADGAGYLVRVPIKAWRQYSSFVYVCPDSFWPRHGCDSACSESAIGILPIVYGAT
jgi:hypothetical protein